MNKITPCLWFDGKAEEAVDFYAGIFRNSRRLTVMRYREAGPGTNGSVLSITFALDDQEFIALNGGPLYTFSPAISFFVSCATQQEIDEYWEKLAAGGKILRCGWLTDKFGVSWQIVPAILGEMLRDADAARANRVMQAMLKMVKLDIAGLKDAYGT